MNYWKTLGIKKTTEKSDIKKAYREKLKKTRPDEDEAGFIKLREAYEYALEYAENNYEELENDFIGFEEDEFDDYFDDYEETEECEYVIDEYVEWNIKLNELWGNLEKKYNPECWRELLYEGAPYKLKYYEIARDRIKKLVYKNSYDQVFLPICVHKVIDGFFRFSSDDEVCIHLEKPKQQAWINIVTRISPRIIFSKIHKDVNPDTVDELLSKYYMDIENVMFDNKVDYIDELELRYLPLEAIKISRSFDNYTEEKFAEVLSNLKSEYGDDIELELLKAERILYNGENAKEIVESLYAKLPETDLLFTYRLMNCCMAVGMYYEAYMLIKHTLWMYRSRKLNLKAEEISSVFEAKYKGKSDDEHIQMCRMYLRSNRRKEAISILDKVREKDTWEYHMARALAYFNETDITPGVESYKILAKYPKEDLHILQKLEWKELQARFYFENKEYEKSLDKCREILNRYPESFPIHILRAYADRALNHRYGNYEGMCDYWRVYGERPEITLYVAQVFIEGNHYKDAKNVVGKIPDKCEIQYQYIELLLFKGSYDELKSKWIDYLNLIASKEFNIDVKNKYGLIDLETILLASAEIHWEVQERSKYKDAIKRLYESKNNDYGKTLSKFLYYYLMLDYKNMLTEAKECIKDITDIEENEEALVDLTGTYAMNGMFEQVDDLINNIKIEYPENEEIIIRLCARVATFCRYIGEYEKGIYYGLQAVNNLVSIYSSELLIEMIECYYYMGKKNSIYFQKAIDAANMLFSIFGKHYADGVNQSPYVYLSYAYAELGQVDKAIKALEFMYEYAERDYYRYDFNTFAFKMYLKARMPEKAFEYVLKAKNNDENIQVLREELGYMMLGHYEEAYNNLIKLAEKDGDEGSGDLYACAMHSKYFMDGYIDREFVLDIKAKIEKMFTVSDCDYGANYFHLAHINNILGNEEEAKKYEELAYGYTEWRALDDREMYIQLYTLWSHWYNKEYEKAYDYCKSNIIFDNYFEVEYLYYFLEDMFEKGKLDDFRNRFGNN